jgi:hypothetical protein
MASYSWAPAPGARLISALQTAVARGPASQYPLPTDLPEAWVDLLAQLDNESDCAADRESPALVPRAGIVPISAVNSDAERYGPLGMPSLGFGRDSALLRPGGRGAKMFL